MAMNAGDNDSVMSEINVTPLVDVMLVLLTIFIVTAPLLTNSVAVNLPKATTELSAAETNVTAVSITADGFIYLDDERVPQSILDSHLTRLAADNNTMLEIFADEKVEYGTVAGVMAAIQRAGISKFTFVMMPDKTQ